MQAAGTTLTVSVRDPRKLEFLLELLRGLPYADVQVNEPVVEPEQSSKAERAQRFLLTAGVWEGRDIDARELRERVWKRSNSGS